MAAALSASAEGGAANLVRGRSKASSSGRVLTAAFEGLVVERHVAREVVDLASGRACLQREHRGSERLVTWELLAGRHGET